MDYITPYLTPAIGALALYVYLYMLEKIEFHTIHLLIYLFIGAFIGAWSVDLIINMGIDKELAESFGGFIGILAPQIMEWLVGGELLRHLFNRIGGR
jgi:ABC-type Fe3+-siderophore transport system permease subunit